MAPYSNDLRERVAAAVDHHEGSQREIGRRFRVSLSFIVRLLERRREAGTLAPKPHGGGPNPALSPRDQTATRQVDRRAVRRHVGPTEAARERKKGRH